MLAICTVFLLSLGQVLFKFAAKHMQDHNTISSMIWENRFLWCALVVYGFATVLWIWLLRHIPLSIGYPFIALAFVLVPILAHFSLNESLGWNTFVGAFFIFIGVWISVGVNR